MNINEIIAKELDVKVSQVEKTVELIDQGNTIPFIARYRKEVTGNLSDEQLRDLDSRLTYLRNLEERKQEVIDSITNQEKMTPEIMAALEKAQTQVEVEDIYRPYKQKKRTRATIAKENGLQELADNIINQTDSTDIYEVAKNFLNDNVTTIENAIKGAEDIIAEDISDNAEFRKMLKKVYHYEGLITSEAVDSNEKSPYEIYYNFSEKIKTIPSHRILAINRGEKEKLLKVKITKPEEKVLSDLQKNIILKNSTRKEELKTTILDSWKRLIEPSLDREIRSDLTDKADIQAIDVFGKNAKQLLLGAPLKGYTVLGFDPAYRTGCKLAVIDETGKVLDTAVLYPTEPQNDIEGSTTKLIDLILKNKINVIAIGNGTASRESEQFISNVITKVKEDYNITVNYVIVSEAGASVYSASKLATEEYPDLNVSLRGAISIARRLQDPLAEFVKIDPKAIGIGQYQHDVNQKKLNEELTGVVEDAVNEVGVDINTATPSLLSYVSGINMTIAKNIVKYREENGKYEERKTLLNVPKLGKVTFEQCAGFIRIPKGLNPLENTAVHPESYKQTEELLKNINYKKEDLLDKAKLAKINEELSKINIKTKAQELNIGELTLTDIINELKKPGRDPRDDMPKPILRSDILSFDDLKKGQLLTGTVRNITDFGAFIDIGVKHDGLVHLSELSDKFIKTPSEVVAIGDVVQVKVIEIDREKQKVKLSMKNI
mgnify:FL=1